MSDPRPDTTKTTVLATEVLEPIPASGGASTRLALTPIQAAGMRLAMGVGMLITLTTLGVGVDWFMHAPQAPALPIQKAANDPVVKAMIENYKALDDVAPDRATWLFDLVVAKALLPVFTAILGYIFGSRAGVENTGS
jgi:hypothetical protein